MAAELAAPTNLYRKPSVNTPGGIDTRGTIELVGGPISHLHHGEDVTLADYMVRPAGTATCAFAVGRGASRNVYFESVAYLPGAEPHQWHGAWNDKELEGLSTFQDDCWNELKVWPALLREVLFDWTRYAERLF